MEAFDAIGLTRLLRMTSGEPEIAIGLIDGPVFLDHPDLGGQRIREIAGTATAACTHRESAACSHGTFVAGMLAAQRGSSAPAICPGCTFLLRPIFSEVPPQAGVTPSTTPEVLAAAIVDCVQAGARILNLSVNLTGSPGRGAHHLDDALQFATSRGVIPVVAAANQVSESTSPLTRHAWALPVMACDHAGQPLPGSNFSAQVGRRGISAPGKEVTSLGTNGKPLTISGTSVAAAFVTGALALLWSKLPTVKAADLRFAIANPTRQRRMGLVPPMLDAWSTYQALTGRRWQH